MTVTMTPDPARVSRSAALLAAALTAAACASGGGAAPPPVPKLGAQKAAAVANGYTGGNLALKRRYWAGAAEGFQRAFSFNPTDDTAAYLAAMAYARAGDAPATLEWLHQLFQLDSCLGPLARSFPGVEADPRFHDLLLVLRAQIPKTHRSEVAFTLGTRDLLPGDLAWDPRGKVFYVASLRRRKIVRVTPGAPGAPARAEDFTGVAAQPLDAVLGVKVDAARGRLWAVTAADPAMEGFRREDAGRSQLVAFDLATGAVLDRWSPMTKPPHAFGGLALDGAGSVWVTDTVSGEVHVLRPGAPELVAVAPAGTFIAPKGIAVSADGTRVYVSDLARGVYRLDPATGAPSLLDQPPGPWPAGLDGLVLHANALVGVAGTVSLGRVGRWRLEKDGESFSGMEILDCAHPDYRLPVGGTLVGDDYVYVANSQVDAVEADGSLPPPESLRDLVFLRLPLGK